MKKLVSMLLALTLVLIMGCAQAEDSTSETTAVRIGALKGPTSMGMAQMLKDAGIKVFKSYVNEYCTSIDMAGCSVSLLRLDDEMKKYLDYPVEIPYTIF